MSSSRQGSSAAPVMDGLGARHRLPYLPALDGLRCVALFAVLLEHGGVTFVVGGHFAVTVFFVLSGFLVTALLLQERFDTGRIDLRAFWVRRARRLVPASLVFVAFTIAYLLLSSDTPPSTVMGDGLASLAWLANWRFVLSDRSYGDLFADPTPFAHIWSLAVEEQFYLVLPVVGALLLGRRGRGSTRRFGAALVAIIVASTVWMWIRYVPGSDPLRLYYGTDTRIAELAVGALLAVVVVRRGELLRLGQPAIRGLVAAAAGSFLVIVAMIGRYSSQDGFTYRGGFFIAAALSAVVVLACIHADTWLARALATPPLPALGRLSYGAYLFHWPLYLWMDKEATGLSEGPLLVLRILVTFGLAHLSSVLLEQPIRHGGRLAWPIGGLAWANGSVALAAVLVIVAGTLSQGGGSSLLASGAEPVVHPPPPPPTTVGPQQLAPPPSVTEGDAGPLRPQPAAGTTTITRRPTNSRPAENGTTATLPREASDPLAASPIGGGPEVPPSAPPAPVVDALRVAVVGDSLAGNLVDGLSKWSERHPDIVVYDLTTDGCPISRGGKRRLPDGTDVGVNEWCDWWDDPSDQRTQNLHLFDPDVVMVQDALNEAYDRKLPSWPDYQHPGDPIFDVWLLGEYRSAAKVFSEGGATVVFANAPCVAWERFPSWDDAAEGDRRVASLNQIYDRVVAATTKVADLFDRICPGGKFSDTVEGVPDARHDGIHLSPETSLRLADQWLVPFLRGVAPATNASP